jgi:hypothetical protein
VFDRFSDAGKRSIDAARDADPGAPARVHRRRAPHAQVGTSLRALRACGVDAPVLQDALLRLLETR